MVEIDLTSLHEKLNTYKGMGRTALLPALHDAQDLYGWLPEEAVEAIGASLNVPLAEISGVIDFYTMFYRQPASDAIVRVCCDPACQIAGSSSVLKEFQAIAAHGSGRSSTITVEESPCLGLCQHAPAVTLGTDPISRALPGRAVDILSGGGLFEHDHVAGNERVLTANIRPGHTNTLTDYLQNGGYQALQQALKQVSADIIKTIKASGLVGRGGAAFPTGLKWEACAAAFKEPKYMVCNADESEPGTFKDRVLMEGEPHQLLEGLIIAAYAIGANKGYIYVRGEYRRAHDILKHAIQEASEVGYLGADILGSGFDFEVELRLGAGAYICGEETALFESIVGRQGYPRVKPPYPTTHGLFGKPTVINNVETLSNVPFIIRQGAQGFRSLGTSRSPGTKLFCLSGDVEQPGVYELPFGASMHELIFNLGGGMTDGGQFQAALVGGAAGVFATAENLKIPLTFEDMSAAGLPLGSGVVMVFNQHRDMLAVVGWIAQFFAHESCGKCYPCQLGTRRQVEILNRIAEGAPLPGDIERLRDVGWTMSDASLCGLGHTAATAVLSALDLWPERFL